MWRTIRHFIFNSLSSYLAEKSSMVLDTALINATTTTRSPAWIIVSRVGTIAFTITGSNCSQYAAIGNLDFMDEETFDCRALLNLYSPELHHADQLICTKRGQRPSRTVLNTSPTERRTGQTTVSTWGRGSKSCTCLGCEVSMTVVRTPRRFLHEGCR